MEFDVQVKLRVYQHYAETARRPYPRDIAESVHSDVGGVLAAYQRLRAQQVLVLEAES